MGLIAERTTGITYQTIAGKIIDVNMELSMKLVYTQSLFTIRFSPLHSVKKGDTILVIEADNSIAFSCPDPDDATFDTVKYADTHKLNSNLFNEKFVGKCGYASQERRSITIRNPFAMTYEYVKDQTPL